MSHAASQNQTLYSLCSFSLANQLHVLMYHALVVLTSLLAVGSNTPTSPDEEATPHFCVNGKHHVNVKKATYP